MTFTFTCLKFIRKVKFKLHLPVYSSLVDEKIEILNEQVNDMEEYSNLVNAPESCGHLKLLGATKSKNISIDFDGKGANIAPLEVCDQNSN